MTTEDPSIDNLTLTIDQLNAERRLFQLPVVVTMGVIMVTAILGNLLVIYVYVHKKRNPASLFILLLAFGDLTSSSLCIPFQIFDLMNPYKHPVPIACKIFRYVETFVNIWCGMILMCIAFDRFFKICYPLQTLSLGRAKKLAIGVFVLTLMVSWPQLILVGTRTVSTRLEGVFGEDCSTQDKYFGSVYSLIFQATISTLFGVCLVIFVLFYGRIFLVVWRRKRMSIGERYSFRSSSNSDKVGNDVGERNRIAIALERTDSNKSCDNEGFCDEGELDKYPEPVQPENSSSSFQDGVDDDVFDETVRKPETQNGDVRPQTISIIGEKPRECPISPKAGRFGGALKISHVSSRVKFRTSRTTLIFGLVTVGGVLSFLPYLIVEVLRQSGAAFQPGMGKSEDLAYEFMSKSYFLNTIVNPFIYSIVNPQFRRDSKAGLKRLFRC